MEKAFISDGSYVQLRYDVWRNITTSKDTANKVSVFVGVVSSKDLLEFNDQDNVRRYLGRKDKPSNNVQRDILSSLEDNPELFSLLNGGTAIVARGYKIDADRKKVHLAAPSIINGSQTQGVISNYHENPENPEVPVKIEVIVTSDEDLIAEISIARNVQTAVKPISITGRRGGFDWFNEQLRLAKLPYVLETSESKEGGIDPIEAISMALLLFPETLFKELIPNSPDSKSIIYSSKAKVLSLYDNSVFGVINSDSATLKEKDIAKEARDVIFNLMILGRDLHKKWSGSAAWIGSRIQKGITRDDEGNVTRVSNGWLYPILAAHSQYVYYNVDIQKWELKLPKGYDEKVIIKEIVRIYKTFASEDINTLGTISIPLHQC